MEEYRHASQLRIMGNFVQLLLQLCNLVDSTTAQRTARRVECDHSGPVNVLRGGRSSDLLLKHPNITAHDFVVTGHVNVRNTLIPLLVDDLLGKRKVFLGSLVDKVTVDDQQIGLFFTDFTQCATSTCHRLGFGLCRNELSVTHHRDLLRATLHVTVCEQRRVVDCGLLVTLRRGHSGYLQVGYCDVACVLCFWPGFHHANAVDRQRLRQPIGHSEPDRLPPFFLEVVAVKVRNSAVRVGHLQAWPGAVTITLDVQAETDRRTVNGLGLLSSQVEASGCTRRSEVVLHANRWLAVLTVGLGDLTGGTVISSFKHR